MFSNFLKKLNKQPKLKIERNYGTDILSSVQDILPQTYTRHLQNHKDQILETNNINQEIGIFSPNPSQTNIKLNFLTSAEHLDKKENETTQYCQLSLDYFSLHNKFRQYCITINETRTFQYFINIMTLLCIILLIIKPYNNQDSGIISGMEEEKIYFIFIICDIIFSIHQIIQIISYGLWSCKYGYYRNPLALINGIALFFAVCLRQTYFYIFRILFLLDYIVQLKFFKKLRKICLSIQNSFLIILYITVIICFFLFVFATVGVQVWTNKLDSYCINNMLEVDFYPTRLCGMERACADGYSCQKSYYEEAFVQYSHNFTRFDYIQEAMVSMFIVHFIEGWVEIEQNLSDSFNKYAAAVFLWTYIFISSFFLQNLIVAILLKQFQQENQYDEPPPPFVQINSHTKIVYSNEKRKTIFAQPNYLSRSRSRVLQMLMNSSRKRDKQEKLRTILKEILSSKFTKYFYSALFLGNLIVLSLNDEAAYKNNLEKKLALINVAFLIVYLLEDFARIYVWKQKESKVVLILEFICDSISFIIQINYLDQPFILNTVKGIRLLWLFNEQTSWSNYRVLLSALWKFFSNLPIIIMILLTYGIVFGVLARNFFAGQLKFNFLGYYDLNGTYVPRSNFDSLRETVTSLFVIICSDQWQTIFYNTLETGSAIPYFFFIVVQYLCKFFILPSFITMMLDNYEEAKNEANISKARAEKVISTMQSKSKVVPTKENINNNSQLQFEKKKYFGRLTKISDESEKEEESFKNNSSTLKRSQSKFYQLQVLRSGDDQQIISLAYQQPSSNSWGQYFKNSSLFLLHNKSNLRKRLHFIISHKLYEQIAVSVIFLNLISLGYDKPLMEDSTVLDVFNYIFGIIFIADALIKSLAQGFIWNKLEPKRSYLFNTNNVFDFLILIICTIDDFQICQIQYFKACRALRALRVLRIIRRDSQIEQLNLISQALYQTISLLSSMIFVTGISLWILSIICMTIWKGKLFFCSQVSIKQFIDIVTKEDCLREGGEWIDSITNFDTIQDSLLCLFRLIIGEGWTQQMFTVSDITERDMNPKINASSQNQFIYYLLIFLLNIVLLNLIIGLIINNYRTIKENIGNFQQLNENQKQWLQLMQIMQKKKLITLIPKPFNRYRLFCYKLMNNQYFEIAIFSVLIINLIFCSCYSGKQDVTTQNAFYGMNIFFITIFHIEILIKLLAYGFQFFRDNLNRIDLLFLIVQDILLIIKDEFTLPRLYIIPLVLRSLQILRIFKIYKINRQLRVLIDVIQELIPTLLWVAIFIIFIIIVYTLVGLQIFSTIWSTPQDPQYPYTIEESQRTKTFTNFMDGLLLLIDITTGQYWSLYMADYTLDTKGCHAQNIQQFQTEGARGCSTIFGYFFFISFVVIIRIIITSLFLAMILESYQDCLMENTAAINPYQLEDFLLKWSDYDPQGTGWITPEDFAFLMFEINPPLGFKDENSQYYDFNQKNQKMKSHLYNHKKKMMLFKTEIFQKLSDYQVQIYQNSMVHFKDVCIQLAYNAIKKKNDLQGIEQIEDKIILRQIRKSWEARYPDLVGKKGQQFAVDIFAINSITDILRGVIERRKIKKRIKEMQKEKNLKQLEMNENAYLTTRNIMERYKGRKKSQIRKRVFPFVQNQSFRKNKAAPDNLDHAFSKHKKVSQITTSIQTKKENNNQLQNLNFYIDPSEMCNGFPMKVVYETQKIDFPSISSERSLGNQIFSQSEKQIKKLGGYISEKCSDEENQQDSVLQNQFDHEFFD